MYNVLKEQCLFSKRYIRRNFSYLNAVEEMKVLWWTITRKVVFHIRMLPTKELAQDTTQGDAGASLPSGAPTSPAI